MHLGLVYGGYIGIMENKKENYYITGFKVYGLGFRAGFYMEGYLES